MAEDVHWVRLGAIAQVLRSPEPKASALQSQELRRSQMIGILQQSSIFNYVSSRDEIVDRAYTLLIGAGIAWDMHDLRLLADIEVSGDRTEWPLILVFDADQCSYLGDVAGWIGEVSGVVQTPFVALWQDGQLTERRTGYLGRKLVRELLRLPNATQ